MSLNKIATIISSLTALFLLIIKLIIWIISWSISVLSSAIDSLLDLFVSMFNYFAVKNAEKPVDKTFNYWRWKIEALASLFEWLIITCSWIYIFYKSVIKLLYKEEINFLWISITIMIVSFFITLILVLFLNHVANKTNNLVIKSDTLHYKTDLFTNGWILIALIVINYTWFFYIDWIIWIIISIYIAYSAFELIKKGFLLLLDVSLSWKTVKKIENILISEKRINGYHFLRTRKSWNIKFVDVDLVFNDEIKLKEAHNISNEIEKNIKILDNKCEWIINIHLDPTDDSNK
jgi:cation diffusion facilitator family transporter